MFDELYHTKLYSIHFKKSNNSLGELMRAKHQCFIKKYKISIICLRKKIWFDRIKKSVPNGLNSFEELIVI